MTGLWRSNDAVDGANAVLARRLTPNAASHAPYAPRIGPGISIQSLGTAPRRFEGYREQKTRLRGRVKD
jgi:hypothetical protein